jgi:hypothetical protein
MHFLLICYINAHAIIHGGDHNPGYRQIWRTEYQTNRGSTDNNNDKRKKAGLQQGYARTTLVIIMK